MSLWKRKKKYGPALWMSLPAYKKRLPKLKPPKRTLKPMSHSQKQRLACYATQRRRYLKRHPMCAICSKRKATDVHHRLGRGRYLLDERTWLALCRMDHQWIHDHPKLAFAKGWLVSRLAKTRATPTTEL